MNLTAEAVQSIMLDCLHKDGEDREGAIIVEGVVGEFGLHPDRLEAHKGEIAELLAELPGNFHAGGGWSFLNACMDKHGRQWGEHNDINALIVLGIATEQARWLVPRDMWPSLPGGMPYFAVGTSGVPA